MSFHPCPSFSDLQSLICIFPSYELQCSFRQAFDWFAMSLYNLYNDYNNHLNSTDTELVSLELSVAKVS